MPKKALTDAAVQRIKRPAKGQVDYFDKGYPGLALRVSYGDARSFVFFYRFGLNEAGKPKLKRMTLGPYRALQKGEEEPHPEIGSPLTLRGARHLWRKAKDDLLVGRDPARSPVTGTSASDFKSVAAQWILRDQAKNKSRAIVARLLDVNVMSAWEHRQIRDIGRRDVLDVIDAIVDRSAVVTARRVQAHLHRLFRWAVGRGIVSSNPVADLPKPGKETPRERVLTDDELKAVWEASTTLARPFRDALRLLILTGARREEIGQLQWPELQDDCLTLSGARTKNGQPHVIPLSTASLEIVADLPRIITDNEECPYLFTIDGRKHISGWSRAKANIDKQTETEVPWRIHDLRRTVATGLQRLGFNLQVIEAVLGHVSGSRAGIVGVYQRHSFNAEKRAALEAWSRFVLSLVEQRSGNVVEIRQPA